MQITGTAAVVGHIGFDRIETGANGAICTHAFAHYLHHKYFDVNCSDGMVPIDLWFGTWHDGTKAGEAQMETRHAVRRARINDKG